MLIFTHIPKTAGSSFHASFKENFRCLAPARFHKYRVYENYVHNRIVNLPCNYLYGHLPYGVDRLVVNRKIRYITLLRNPLDRCLSSIRHFLSFVNKKDRGPEHILDAETERFLARKPGPLKLLKYLCDRNINGNAMVKQLSPVPINRMVLYSAQTAKMVLFPPFLQMARPLDEQELHDALEQAKQNLSRYSFIGFQDRFYESIGFFGRIFSVDVLVPESRLKKTAPNIFPFDKTDRQQMQLLNYMNRYDIELYQYALEITHGSFVPKV
jgi:hypothetical protein